MFDLIRLVVSENRVQFVFLPRLNVLMMKYRKSHIIPIIHVANTFLSMSSALAKWNLRAFSHLKK